MSVATPTEVRMISVISESKTREQIPIRVKPLSYIPTIASPTALSVDMFSPAHKRCPRINISRTPTTNKLSNISDEYSIPRQIHSVAQCEV
jgi:hypothetical protein